MGHRAPVLLLAAFMRTAHPTTQQLHTQHTAFLGPEQYTCHDLVAPPSNARVYALFANS